MRPFGKFVLLLLAAAPLNAADDAPWDAVRAILQTRSEPVVFDRYTPRPSHSEDPRTALPGGWLIRHEPVDPGTLNPYLATDTASRRVLEHVFESCLYIDKEPPYAVRPLVARSRPQVSDDHLQYSFTLRPEVRFADGTPLTAADLLFSLKVLKNPQVQISGFMRNHFVHLVRAEAPAPDRAIFTYSQPYFLNETVLGQVWILPRHHYDPEGLLAPVTLASLADGSWESGPHAERVRRFAQHFNQLYNTRPLGSGPYLIADPDADVVTQQKVVLSRNPNYWGKGRPDLPPAGHVDRIVSRVISNADAAFIELGNGRLDTRALQPLEFRHKIWSESFTQRFLTAVGHSSGFLFIAWNNTLPIFADQRTRQALSHLTPRQEMIDNLLYGLGMPVNGPVHAFRPEYHDGLTPYAYDPDRALDLLEEAGWRDRDNDGLLDRHIDGRSVPFRFEFMVSNGYPLGKDIALVLQSELADVGIDCQVRELDWSIFLERLRTKDFAAFVVGLGAATDQPPDIYANWHSSQYAGDGVNVSGFADAEVDSLLETYRQTFDADRRIALYRRVQEVLHAQQPWTFLWTSRWALSYHRRFQGVQWYPFDRDIRQWWVPAGDRLY